MTSMALVKTGAGCCAKAGAARSRKQKNRHLNDAGFKPVFRAKALKILCL
jgi:hypothetical protein